MDKVETLQQAIIYFQDYQNCHDLMVQLRWPDGKVTCPRCGAEKVTYLAKARVWKCYAKHKSPTFTLKTGTIFEDSPISVDKWLVALWLVVNCKNGISSMEIHRDLGVTQKTAWFMAHRLRLALQQGGFILSGEVEVDETFIGGKARNMHATKLAKRVAEFATPKGTGRNQTTGKVAVMGLLERKGKVRTVIIQNTTRRELHAEVNKHVEFGSTVHTDALSSYNQLEREYIHNVINHAVKYVDGQIHTNGIENFWSLLKRGLGGTYISVEPYHLFRYLDEQVFRYNNRKGMKDAGRFLLALSQITGKRLTYSELTGKDAQPSPAVVK